MTNIQKGQVLKTAREEIYKRPKKLFSSDEIYSLMMDRYGCGVKKPWNINKLYDGLFGTGNKLPIDSVRILRAKGYLHKADSGELSFSIGGPHSIKRLQSKGYCNLYFKAAPDLEDLSKADPNKLLYSFLEKTDLTAAEIQGRLGLNDLTVEVLINRGKPGKLGKELTYFEPRKIDDLPCLEKILQVRYDHGLLGPVTIMSFKDDVICN